MTNSTIFTEQRLSAAADMDVVRITFGSEQIVIPYRAAFNLVAGVRMAGKMAMRAEGLPASKWREFAAAHPEEEPPPPNRQARLSGIAANVSAWDVKLSMDSTIVTVAFKNLSGAVALEAGMHYSDALRFSTMIRHAAKAAKGWAGDSSNIWNATAFLADAEENDKRGYR